VMGGSLGEMHGKKIANIMRLAIDSRCPIIGINDSGGARIQEGVNALSRYGEIFRLNTIASGYIPQISIIAGPCAGGAVYSPGITDFVFVIDKISQMYVTGPQVIKKVLFQDIDSEKLGGAEMHSNKSGVAHYNAKDEDDCYHQVKNLLQYIPHRFENLPKVKVSDNYCSGLDFLNFKIPENEKQSYDVKVLIEEIFRNNFFEISQSFAQNIVIGFGKLDGQTIGVIANQPKIFAGVLDCDASDKAARFIRYCDAFNIPILTLVDVPGFLPGVDQELKGIIRHGAKLLYAYSEATIPMVTLITRKAFGGAYIAMGSKHLGADFVFAWPSAQIAVMGAEGAVEVLYRKEIQQTKGFDFKSKLQEYSKLYMNPRIAAENGIIDEVINPEQTREYIVRSFSLLKDKTVLSISKKHGNMPL
jgi:methylmalonyl-CoA decarboxylase subunit alpha